MKGVLTTIKPNGTIIRKELTAPPTLVDLQTAVGGYIEVIPAFDTYEGKPCFALCNEEGKLLRLAYNAPATVLWEAAAHRPMSDRLVGSIAIVTGDAELLEAL